MNAPVELIGAGDRQNIRLPFISMGEGQIREMFEKLNPLQREQQGSVWQEIKSGGRPFPPHRLEQQP